MNEIIYIVDDTLAPPIEGIHNRFPKRMRDGKYICDESGRLKGYPENLILADENGKRFTGHIVAWLSCGCLISPHKHKRRKLKYYNYRRISENPEMYPWRSYADIAHCPTHDKNRWVYTYILMSTGEFSNRSYRNIPPPPMYAISKTPEEQKAERKAFEDSEEIKCIECGFKARRNNFARCGWHHSVNTMKKAYYREIHKAKILCPDLARLVIKFAQF